MKNVATGPSADPGVGLIAMSGPFIVHPTLLCSAAGRPVVLGN